MNRARDMVILGAGGHGRVVADICRRAGMCVAGFLDNGMPGGIDVAGIPVLGGDALLDDPKFIEAHEFLVAVADQRIRRPLATGIRERGGALARAIHPAAVVAADVYVGFGTVVMAGAVVNTGARVGDCVIVNTGATVDHDCVLEDGVHICPGAHLAGGVTCAEDVFVGVGAAIIQGCRVGARAVVGAGAVVIADVPSDVTAVGCPARALKRKT